MPAVFHAAIGLERSAARAASHRNQVILWACFFRMEGFVRWSWKHIGCRWCCAYRSIGKAPLVSFLALLASVAIGPVASAQQQQAVCDSGEGHFEAALKDGAGVKVGPAASGAFAARTCSAKLMWKGETILDAAKAGQIDVDVMGANLGFGVPVVALEIRQDADDWRAMYSIYSLDRSPRLLAKLTGGDVYRAADADFDGEIAIWTTDAAAVQGFDGLRYADFDFAPTVVLRYEHRKLEDVSADYPKQYDAQIAQVRGQLTTQGLAAFQASDGKLEDGYRPWSQLIPLRKTKAKVLEIVWSYLYSGREAEAWAELAQMWPASDVERAKAAMIAVRAKGFDAEAASVATPSDHRHHRRVTVYATTGASRQISQTAADGTVRSLPNEAQMDVFNQLVDVPPQPITLMRSKMVREPETVLLTIDEAGKVWSVKTSETGADQELLESAKDWKFIPAFVGGHAVACRTKMDIQAYQ